MRLRSMFRASAAALLGLLALLPSPQMQAQSAAPVEWRHYSADTLSTKYSPAAQIDAANAGRLRVLWRWASADNALKLDPPIEGQRYSDTPLVANGVLYTVTSLGQIAALDPATGQTRWVFDPVSYRAGRPVNIGFIHRGLAYWTDGRTERLLLGTHDAHLISVDAKTGALDPKFGSSGKVDLTIGIKNAVPALNFTSNSAPLIAGDVVVVGSTINDFPPHKEDVPGDVRGFDVRTGRLLWTFHTIPRRGEPGYETWLDGSAEYSGSANVWTTMSYDPELDYVYLPTGTSTNHRYGGHRPGNNLFAESIVCVEAKTGKRVWHYQAVHHGLWDYDFPAPPVLGDITVNGRRIKAVMQVSKQAYTYVLDRRTGEPVWPIEERPAPPATVPGERPSPTQPHPTKPPAFDLQGAIEANLVDYTPELTQRAREILHRFHYGPLFTPASEKGTLFLPGMNGGANWGGAAFDPETGMLYVPSFTNAGVYQVEAGDPAKTNFRYDRGRMLGLPSASIDGLPLFKPPYSRVTAIEMNRGEHAWVTALGDGPRRHPLIKDLNLPALGARLRGGPMVTKTLLFVAVLRDSQIRPAANSAEQWSDPADSRRMVYIFDKHTGRQVGALEIDGVTTASPPMTYIHGGKQYVVVAVGAGRTAELVAFGL